MKVLHALQWGESWTTPTVIMSDLHINGGARDSEVIKRLLWITDPERGDESELNEGFPLIKRVILLGDIFDFQLGYQSLIYSAHLEFLKCLKTLRERDVELIMFTGNHDPDPHPAFTKDLGISVCEHPTIFKIYGELVRCEHGDLLEPSWFKRALCKIVRSPSLLLVAKCLPAQFIWSLTSRWGAVESDQGVDADEQLLLNQVIDPLWPQLEEEGIDRWVFGHFHQATSWGTQGSPLPNVFVTGDQVHSHSLLLWTAEGPSLYHLATLPPVRLNIR